MRHFIAKITLPARRMMIRMVAPRLYRDTFTHPFKTRPAILFVKGIMGDAPLTGAEVGVGIGLNAENILKTLNIRMLYLIDQYKPYIEQDKVCFNPVARAEATARLSLFQDRIRFIYLDSEVAIRSVDAPLDFVYIDGNHHYECVKRDIVNYYRKVKRGGVIGGHDFCNHALGVIRAVTEFSHTKGVQLMVEGTTEDSADWWMVRQ